LTSIVITPEVSEVGHCFHALCIPDKKHLITESEVYWDHIRSQGSNESPQ
jgi:hypothetical protein